MSDELFITDDDANAGAASSTGENYATRRQLGQSAGSFPAQARDGDAAALSQDLSRDDGYEVAAALDDPADADDCSVSSDEERRRAVSVLKVQDWDDAGGELEPSPRGDPGATGGGSATGGSGGGGDEQSQADAQAEARAASRMDAELGTTVAHRSSLYQPHQPHRAPPAQEDTGGTGHVQPGAAGDSAQLARGGSSSGMGASGGSGSGFASAAAALQSGHSCGTGTATSTSSPTSSQKALEEPRGSDSEQQLLDRKAATGPGADASGPRDLSEVAAASKATRVLAGSAAAASRVAVGAVGVAPAAAAAAVLAKALRSPGSAAEHAAVMESSGAAASAAARAAAAALVPSWEDGGVRVEWPVGPLPPTIIATRMPDPERWLDLQQHVDRLLQQQQQQLQPHAQMPLQPSFPQHGAPSAALGSPPGSSRHSAAFSDDSLGPPQMAYPPPYHSSGEDWAQADLPHAAAAPHVGSTAAAAGAACSGPVAQAQAGGEGEWSMMGAARSSSPPAATEAARAPARLDQQQQQRQQQHDAPPSQLPSTPHPSSPLPSGCGWPAEAVQAARMATLQVPTRPQQPSAASCLQQPQQPQQQQLQQQQQQDVLQQDVQRGALQQQQQLQQQLQQQQLQVQRQIAELQQRLSTMQPGVQVAWEAQQKQRELGAQTAHGVAPDSASLQLQSRSAPQAFFDRSAAGDVPPAEPASSSQPLPSPRPQQHQQHGQHQQHQQQQGAAHARAGAQGHGQQPQQAHPHAHHRRDAPAAAPAEPGPPAEVLTSHPSFRHHLQLETQAPAAPLDSARRTSDWVKSTTAAAAPPPAPVLDAAAGPLVSLQPHPAARVAAAWPRAEGAAAAPPQLSSPGSMQRSPSQRHAPPPSGSMQRSPSQRHSPPPSGSMRRSPSQRHPSALLGRSGSVTRDAAANALQPPTTSGGHSSHGGSRHSSRHGSRHDSRRHESTRERKKREAMEVLLVQQKLASQAPPSPLALLGARLMHEAGEKLAPAPRMPGGKAFFVPLRHELRLEMSEKMSSTAMSESQAGAEVDDGISFRSFATGTAGGAGRM